MNFYRRYIGDYARDTAHLSLAEHGAYSLLLDTYYAAARPLPADYQSLYRICRAHGAVEQRAVRNVAEQFFPIEEDGLRHNTRADRQIPDEQKRIDVAKQNGTHGGRRKEPSGLAKDNPAGNPAGSQKGTQQGTGWANSPSPSPFNSLRNTESPPTAIARAESGDSGGGGQGPPDPGDRATAEAFLATIRDATAAAGNEDEEPTATVGAYAAMAIELRRRGVRCTSSHPELIALVDAGFTVPEVVEAASVAAMQDSAPKPMNVGYLASVARTQREVAKRPARAEPAWWSSEQGTLRKAAELGMAARGGEDWNAFRQRIRDRMGESQMVRA